MSEDGDAYTLDFEPGLTDKELDSLRTKFPSNTIAGELIEILKKPGDSRSMHLSQPTLTQ